VKAERGAEIAKLWIPIVAAGAMMIIGAFTLQIGWVAAGAGLLGVPFLMPTSGFK
jgi:hypothetical protein